MDRAGVEFSIIECSTTCVIHFSSRGRKLGRFCRYPVSDKVSSIYLNPIDVGWYMDGIPSLGSTLQDSIDFLTDKIEFYKFEKVVCIGSSMGAFGAALFASRLNVACICFGPELSLGVYSGFSAQNKMNYVDVFEKHQPAHSLFVAGLACPTDTLVSSYYQSLWENSKLIVVPEIGHETARYLKDNNELESLINDYIHGKVLSKYFDFINEKQEFLSIFSKETPQKISLKVLEDYYQVFKKDIIASQKLWLAEHLTNRNVFSLAEIILQEFISDYGVLNDAVFELAKLYRKMQRFDESLALFKSLELEPEYNVKSLWGQSMVYKKMTKPGVQFSIIEGSRTCIIHFSSRQKALGKFCRYPVPLDSSNIYINPADTGWYLNGIPSLGATLQDTIDFLSIVIKFHKFEKVVCIGSSMGAFGAALFASRLNVECICFGPELALGGYGGLSAKDKMNYVNVFEKQQPANSLLITGLACPTDTLISIYYQSLWENSKLIILPSAGHETDVYLKNENNLESIIADYLSNKCLEVYSDFRYEKREGITPFYGLMPEMINSKVLDDYYQILGTEIIATQKLKLAELCTNRNVLPLAEKILKGFIREYGPLSEAIFLLAKLCRKMNDSDEALMLFKQLEGNPEYRLQGLWGQSMIYHKARNTDEASRLYELIIAGAATLPIVRESKKWLQKSNELKLIEEETV